MSPAITPKNGWLRRSIAWCTAWLLRHGQRPYAIWFLSSLAILDGMIPMMPAEFMALALMILQPRRLVLVATAFAMSAAVSAGLLATLIAGLAQATAWPGWIEGERQGTGWAQAVALIQSWGAPALGLAAIFPDSPRTSIAVAALAGRPSASRFLCWPARRFYMGCWPWQSVTCHPGGPNAKTNPRCPPCWCIDLYNDSLRFAAGFSFAPARSQPTKDPHDLYKIRIFLAMGVVYGLALRASGGAARNSASHLGNSKGVGQ